MQRLFIHRIHLRLQQLGLFLPIGIAAEPGKVDGKDRVVKAAGEPRAVVDEAQGAQRLDQHQLAPVKRPELLVTFYQGGELCGLLRAVS